MDLIRHFSKEEIHMASKHRKQCSISLIFKKMQIKTTGDTSSHLLGWLFKRKNIKCWWGCKETGILVHCCWECKMAQVPSKTVWWLLKKLKTRIMLWSGNTTLRVYNSRTENKDSNGYLETCVHGNIIQQQPKVVSNLSIYWRMNR